MVSGLPPWVSGKDPGIVSVAAQAVEAGHPPQHKLFTCHLGGDCRALADLPSSESSDVRRQRNL